jgi:hypothetical protein
MSTIINILKILYLIPRVIQKDYQNRKWRKTPQLGDIAYFENSQGIKTSVVIIQINSDITRVKCMNEHNITGIYRLETLKFK